MSFFSFPPTFKTRRSITLSLAFAFFFILSTILFLFNNPSTGHSPILFKSIFRNRSHFSSIFSHFFPNTTNSTSFSRKTNGSFFSVPNSKPLSDGELLNNIVESSKEELEMLSKCNLFDGNWVKDDELPIYEPGSCPHIDEPFNCFLNGRPDNGYERYRWQPKHCNIPRYVRS